MAGLVTVLLAATLAVPPLAAHAADDPFASCQAPGTQRVVGVVACERMPSADLGGTTAFEYFLPDGCADRRCPTVYLLHGFGGDLTSMLGTPSDPSAWVAALDHQPQVSPYMTNAPWDYADQTKWKPAAPIDAVLVAPDGRTVPGGRGPQPWLDGFWADWNPRYARGGAKQSYDTPPPRFASYVADELVPFVETHLGVARGRASRVLDGESLGGYGSYAIGLTHPDEWATIGADSGIMNILLAPGLGTSSPSAVPGVLPPAPLPAASPPSPLGAPVPLAHLPGEAKNIGVVLYAFGDPAVDQSYYLARQPVDLALNAAAFAHGRQSVMLRDFSNDTIPRRTADLSLPGYLSAQAFEDLVLPTNLELNQAFAAAGVQQHYELHPGIHEDVYWNPWLRSELVAQYAVVRHWDGGGNPPPWPARFSYVSGASAFEVWGWRVSVRRPVAELLRLTDASCDSFTLHGTGAVTVTVPRNCGTGVNGSRRVTVDLGPSLPMSQTMGMDATPGYGRTVTVRLSKR